MKPDFDKFLKKISENNNMLMDAIQWNAEAFRKELETNYVFREKYHEEQEKVKRLETELERMKIVNDHSNDTMAGEITDLMIKALDGKTMEEHNRIGDEYDLVYEATYTIKIGSINIIEKSTFDISMAKTNGVSDRKICDEEWNAMKKARTKARKDFLDRLPEFYGMDDKLDEALDEFDLDNISKYSDYLKE